MADYSGNNIFEKLGSFIPGYKGYTEKEGRRDTDKLLRMEIARQLDRLKSGIDDVIRRQNDERKIDLIPELDRIKRKLGLVADQIRYASYGECGFFDVVQVDISDLDSLYQYDLDIQEETAKLATVLNNLNDSGNLRKDCSAVISMLTSMSMMIENRDKVILEVC
jgi:hypothetical protein